MQNSHHKIVIILVAAFTLLQFIILLVFGYTPYPDSEGYLYLAKECVAHGEPYPVTSMLCKYPFLWNIGAINAVTASLAIFHSVVPLLVLYSLLKGITAALFYAVTRKICNSQVAFIALVLYVIYPANYGEGTSTLSELPFMFFIMLGMYLSIVRNWSLAGGIMLAVANWFRPMAIVFLLAMLIYFMFKWRKNFKLVVGYLLMIGIIGTMTMYRTGLFLYQAKSGWMNLAIKTYESGYQNDWNENPIMIREHNEWNVSQKDSAWQHLYTEWTKKHPKEYVSRMPGKILNTYVSDNANMCTFITGKTEKKYMYDEVSMQVLIKLFPYYSPVQWLTIVNLLVYYFLLATALISILYFNRQQFLLPVSIIAIGTIILMIIGHGESRFHIPFIPFIMMLTALLLVRRKKKNV